MHIKTILKLHKTFLAKPVLFIKIFSAVSSARHFSCCVPVGHGRRVVVAEAGLSRPHTPRVCGGLVGGGVVPGAGRHGAQ